MGSRTKGIAGFTLVEMLVTISVLTVVLSIGLPSFRNLLGDNRLAAESNEFMTVLALARTEALKRGVPVTVCRATSVSVDQPTCANSGDWFSGWLIYAETSAGATGTRDESEPLIAARGRVPGGNTLSGNNNVERRVTFSAQGMTTNWGTWTLQDASRADKGRCIRVALTGRVSVGGLNDEGSCS